MRGTKLKDKGRGSDTRIANNIKYIKNTIITVLEFSRTLSRPGQFERK